MSMMVYYCKIVFKAHSGIYILWPDWQDDSGIMSHVRGMSPKFIDKDCKFIILHKIMCVYGHVG